MDRVFRASNGVYFYVAFLLLDALVLAAEAISRLRAGQGATGGLLALLAVACLAIGALLYLRWGRIRITVSPESLTVSGQGDRAAQHLEWADVERVRELKGPAYQLSLRGLLPGPYLPHGLLRGETVLEIDAHPGQKVLVRRSLVSGYGALQQDVIRSVPKDAEVDLHARWWRD
jgi:hypothetical protein